MMTFRLAVATLLCLGALPALAQEAASPPAAAVPPVGSSVAPAAPAPKPATVKVSLVTSVGTILLELEKERAPITTKNFLHYVDTKRFDNTLFYRAFGTPDFGLVQGGVKYDPKKVFPPIAHEPTSKTGVLHIDGTISMARNAPGTAAGDFFIIIGNIPSMDAKPTASGDNQGYAAFGHVIEGMDVVKKIVVAPRSATLGEGVMKGQMLDPTIRIISARRVADTPAPAAAPPAASAH